MIPWSFDGIMPRFILYQNKILHGSFIYVPPSVIREFNITLLENISYVNINLGGILRTTPVFFIVK